MNAQAIFDFDPARRERDTGMATALAHAEQVNDGWGDVALAKLTIYARTHAQFTSYDFRQAYTGPEPPTPKAFGPAFLKAAKQGVIQRVGYQPHPERHCSPTPVWRSLICAEAA